MSAASNWTNLLSQKLKIKQKKQIKDFEKVATVNEHGIAEFKDLPIGVYKIVVPEFWDYHSAVGEAWMVEPNIEGFYSAFVEIFKTGLAVTQIFVEFPKLWV